MNQSKCNVQSSGEKSIVSRNSTKAKALSPTTRTTNSKDLITNSLVFQAELKTPKNLLMSDLMTCVRNKWHWKTLNGNLPELETAMPKLLVKMQLFEEITNVSQQKITT